MRYEQEAQDLILAARMVSSGPDARELRGLRFAEAQVLATLAQAEEVSEVARRVSQVVDLLSEMLAVLDATRGAGR